MLFNSYTFLLLFLPVTMAGFHWLVTRRGAVAATTWLAMASLGFYGWWNPKYLPLMLASIAFNYWVGRHVVVADTGRRWMWLGIVGNLALLGYYKYSGFFADNLRTMTGWGPDFGAIILPIGISFYTFTQIAYLVDMRRGIVHDRGPVNYLLFVTYFPHLIAGPIIHFRDLSGQFARMGGLTAANLAAGLTLFVIGLFKKVVVADSLAPDVDAIFGAAETGATPTFAEAWYAALGYTFQLYFDFSGYADMALGLGRMLGIVLPINFDSPYRATSLIEFWRRWHITLSQFLRDYLYIPLGGGRRGKMRRYLNLGVVMLLGGLWHGAGWTFVAWGVFHGVLLVLNHLWRDMLIKLDLERLASGRSWQIAAIGLTFLCVVIAWVLFRAGSLAGAGQILSVMLSIETGGSAKPLVTLGVQQWLMLVMLLGAVWFLPNSQQIIGIESGVHRDGLLPLVWRVSRGWAVTTGVLLFLCLSLLSRPSPFLYFQF